VAPPAVLLHTVRGAQAEPKSTGSERPPSNGSLLRGPGAVEPAAMGAWAVSGCRKRRLLRGRLVGYRSIACAADQHGGGPVSRQPLHSERMVRTAHSGQPALHHPWRCALPIRAGRPLLQARTAIGTGRRPVLQNTAPPDQGTRQEVRWAPSHRSTLPLGGGSITTRTEVGPRSKSPRALRRTAARAHARQAVGGCTTTRAFPERASA
jgi:hypothetical protein